MARSKKKKPVNTGPQIVFGAAVDEPWTRDRDDAISLRKFDDGWKVAVHIANVASRISLGSDREREARRKAFTRYLRRGSIPMFPGPITEQELSLQQDRDNPVISFQISLGLDLAVKKFAIKRADLRDPPCLSYGSVERSIHDPQDLHHRRWADSFDLAIKLLQKRRSEGAFAIYDIRRGLYTSEDGKILRIPRGLHASAHIVVQEFMILANSAASSFFRDKKVPMLFRNQIAKREDVDAYYVKALNDLLGQATDVDLARLNTEVNSALSRADYGIECKGHLALGGIAYGHFTSPIRRYADYFNQLMILAWLEGKPPPFSPEEGAEIAIQVNSVQAEMRNAKSAVYIEARQSEYAALDRAGIVAMDDGKFSGLVGNLVDGKINLTKFRALAISDRLTAGTINTFTLAKILFQGIGNDRLWTQLKAICLRWLDNNLTEIFAIANSAAQLNVLPELDNLPWKTQSLGARHPGDTARMHQASLEIMLNDEHVVGGPCSARLMKLAKQLALRELFGNICKVTVADIDEEFFSESTAVLNPKSELGKIVAGQGLREPVFTTTSIGGSRYSSSVTLVIEDRTYTGGPCKREGITSAEQAAARELLRKLPCSILGRAKSGGPDCLGALNLWCSRQGILLPSFSTTRGGDRAHLPVFSARCSLVYSNQEYVQVGVGKNKSSARQDAARKMCEILNLPASSIARPDTADVPA